MTRLPPQIRDQLEELYRAFNRGQPYQEVNHMAYQPANDIEAVLARQEFTMGLAYLLSKRKKPLRISGAKYEAAVGGKMLSGRWEGEELVLELVPIDPSRKPSVVYIEEE